MSKKSPSKNKIKISDEDFYEKIHNKYSIFAEPKKKRSYNEICFPKKYVLRNSQKFPSAYISPNTNFKSILLFHQIGSGKTCSMIRIGEAWKNKRKVIFVCPAGLINNFMGELRSECADNEYISEKDKEKLKTLDKKSEEYLKIIEKSDKRISKHYDIYSQHMFINKIKKGEIDFTNKILLIDEIQNMVSAKGTFYSTLKEAIFSAPTDLRIVLATATPMFDKPYEIGLTMNLLRLPKQFPDPAKFTDLYVKKSETSEGVVTYSINNKQEFRESLRGYVSYFSGGDPISMPEKRMNIVKCKMSKYQYKAYMTTLKDSSFFKRASSKGLKVSTIFSRGEILDLPNNFFIGPRIISNIAYPNGLIGDNGLKAFDGSSEMIDTCSTKINQLLANIEKSKGKSYIYSNFRNNGGLLPIIKALEKNGYSNYETKGVGKKRYAIWSGEETKEYRCQVVAEYNKQDNNYGEKLKILLISPAGKEGLSLFGVRDAHIFEPYWNISRLDQIIGRGIRFCSHKNMEESERFVNIFMYLSIGGKSISIDEYIYSMAIKKDLLIKQFEKELINSSVDRKLY